MLPSLVSQLVVILKDTALGYLITYPDLIRSMTNLSAVKGNLVTAFMVAAVIFIVINYGADHPGPLARAPARRPPVRSGRGGAAEPGREPGP